MLTINNTNISSFKKTKYKNSHLNLDQFSEIQQKIQDLKIKRIHSVT